MADRAPNINRSKLHEDIVQRLSMQNVPGSDRKLFPTIRELLCFAALLGFSEKRRVPLDRAAGVEDISYQQFERDPAAEDLLWTIAVAETQDTEVLRDGEKRRSMVARGRAYALKPDFFERISLERRWRADGSRSPFSTRLKPIWGPRRVELALALHQAGLDARLYLRGFELIARNGCAEIIRSPQTPPRLSGRDQRDKRPEA